jgi:hypothetical protein
MLISVHHIDVNLNYFDQALKYQYENPFFGLRTDSVMIHVRNILRNRKWSHVSWHIFEIYVPKHENSTKDITK